MTDLSKNSCVYCGMSLEGGDVVFCPDCGTPVHRECWREHGKCPNEALHADGFQWKSAAEVFAENERHHEKELLERERENDDPEGRRPSDGPTVFFYGTDGVKTDANPDEEKYMGVSERELFSFIGVKSPQGLYRLAILKNMAATGKKISFNVFSGILKPYYQFYKGMYALGIPLLVLEFLLAIPELIYYYSYYTENEALVTLVTGNAFYTLSAAASYVGMALLIALSLFGDYLYLRYAVRKIKVLREAFSDASREEYFTRLRDAGESRWIRVLQAFLLQAGLALVIFFIFGRV